MLNAVPHCKTNIKLMSMFFTKRFSLLFLLISVSSSLASAQQKLNLDFEKLSVEGPSRPWGWSVYRYAQNVRFVCDTSATVSGKYSLKIQNDRKHDSERFELSFFIEPSQILNSRLSISGWAKTRHFTGTSGMRITSIGTVENDFGVLKQNEIVLEHTENWEKYTTHIDIGSKPHTVLVTLYFSGSGTVWFDKLQLSVNDEEVLEVPVAPEFTGEQLSALAKETIPFDTPEPFPGTEAGKEAFRDLEDIRALVGDAKIIALGESTHGTREFFKVKHRLFQFAIFELGVRVFVLEDNQLLMERINEYVLHGKGEAETLIKGLFAVWNTREMLQLIKWLRDYNEKHPDDKVEFVGMDVQNPQLALEHLHDFLARHDLRKQEASNRLLHDIKAAWRNSYFQADSMLLEWDRAAQANFTLVQSGRDKWLKEARNKQDSVRVEWAIQNARTIKQFTETALGGIYEGRDKAMAENIEWIINQRKPGTKILVWAHDSHVSRGEAPEESANFFFGQSMGAYLSKKYGNDYYAFGLFTYQGSCLGTISYSDFTQKPFQIYTSPIGSLDAGLHRIALKLGKPHLILDLNPFKNDLPEYQWINTKRPVRYVGYVAEDYGFGGRYRIPFQFDSILFIDRSTAASKLN